MGAVWTTVISYSAFLTEFAGQRSGITINRNELHSLLGELQHYDGMILWDDDHGLRIRSEEIQQTAGFILHRLGAIENYSDGSSPILDVEALYWHDSRKRSIVASLGNELVVWLSSSMGMDKPGVHRVDNRQKVLNPEPFLSLAKDLYGQIGIEIAVNLLQSLRRAQLVFPWSDVSGLPWEKPIELKSLFESAGLNPDLGSFIDQRFIDYLSNNTEDIGNMHWRKFEALASEYLERQGMKVELGPGGNDDGVDIRAWLPDQSENVPPAMLVQCKRHKEKVGKVVVKSLWADMNHENAPLGMIVTSSRLSPGARKTCHARSYPILESNCDHVGQWLQSMRTPGTGVFLGE